MDKARIGAFIHAGLAVVIGLYAAMAAFLALLTEDELGAVALLSLAVAAVASVRGLLARSKNAYAIACAFHAQAAVLAFANHAALIGVVAAALTFASFALWMPARRLTTFQTQA